METFALFALIACYSTDEGFVCVPEYSYETEAQCEAVKPEFEKIADLGTILFCGPNVKGEEK